MNDINKLNDDFQNSIQFKPVSPGYMRLDDGTLVEGSFCEGQPSNEKRILTNLHRKRQPPWKTCSPANMKKPGSIVSLTLLGSSPVKRKIPTEKMENTLNQKIMFTWAIRTGMLVPSYL